MVQTSVYIVCKYADMQVGNGLELYGSQLVKLPGSAIVSVPPYCGVHRVSHQYPVEVVVTLTAVLVVVVVVWADVVVDVVDIIGVVSVVDVWVVIEVDLAVQDASTIETAIKEPNAKIITLFFNSFLLFPLPL